MLYEKFDHFQIWANNTQHVATCRNTSQQGGQTHTTCCTQQCCDMLRRNVAIVWLGVDATFVDVAWCCSRLARLEQQCCNRACALVRFSTRNTISFPEPTCLLVSTKTRSSGIINKLVPRAFVAFAFKICYYCAFKAKFRLPKSLQCVFLVFTWRHAVSIFGCPPLWSPSAA